MSGERTFCEESETNLLSSFGLLLQIAPHSDRNGSGGPDSHQAKDMFVQDTIGQNQSYITEP